MNGNNRRFNAVSVAITVCLLVATSFTTFGQADRETWQPPEKIMDAIGVEPKMRIGEAGAGTGYFTFPLAGRVGPDGIVYANDISTSSLDVIRTRADAEGLLNIETVVGAVEDPLFPETDLDMVVMVYVLHMLEIVPDHHVAVPALAEMLVAKGEGDMALELLKRVPESPEVRRIAALARTGGEPSASTDDLDAKLEALLELVKTDEDARQEFLDLLEVMGADDPRTADYRKQLSLRLF